MSIPAAAAIGIIAVAELFCTSLWFSANGAAAELLRGWGLPPSSVGALTSAVQGGFIFGTLAFALSNLADSLTHCSHSAASASLRRSRCASRMVWRLREFTPWA